MDYLKIYNTLDSTNKEAQRLLAEGPVLNGLTLFARHQTDGRGQLGRIWISEAGSHLAMSIIYQPNQLTPSELPVLGMKVSLGIVRGLKNLDRSLSLLVKWPNDIYVNGKKLCGLLIENSLSGSKVQHSIIGIGMNINESHFSEDLPNAISLHMVTGLYYDPVSLSRMVRDKVISILQDVKTNWKEEYDRYVFGKDSPQDFLLNGQNFHAKVLGISTDGHILLQHEDDPVKAYASHEVKWVI